MQDQLRNQNLWRKMKLIKVRFNALDLNFNKKTTISFLGVCVCVSFFLNVRPFFLWFCGIGLALINKMNCREIFVSLCLQFMAWHNLDPKIFFDAGFWPWQSLYVTVYCQYCHGSKIKQELKCFGTNWNIKVWAVYFKLLPHPPSFLFGWIRMNSIVPEFYTSRN